MPNLELGDKLLNTLGVEAEDLFNNVLTKKEEEEVLQKIIVEYDVPGMKETMDETGKMADNIYFFYVGESQKFTDALEFLGLSPINREFASLFIIGPGKKNNNPEQIKYSC